MVADLELLKRYAAEKSEASFTALVERHVDLVHSAALRRVGGDAHGAADVTQQVFVRLARQAPALARGVVLPAWLYATTRNVAVDHVRAEQRRRAREQEAHMRQQLNANETAAADWERLRPLLDGAMDELGDRDREAVLLRFFARRAFGEIGTTLNVSEDAARMRVDRALEKLRSLLSRRGITSTAKALGLALTTHGSVAAPVGLMASVTSSSLMEAAAGGGGVAFNAAKIMSTMKIGGGVAASLLLVAALGTAFMAVRTQADAKRALAEERARIHTMDVRARELDREASALEAAARDVGTKREAEQAAKIPAATSNGSAKTATARTLADAVATGDAFMAKHPEVKEALGDYARARIRFQFSELYRRLGLTAEQIARFETMLGAAGMGADDPDGNYMSLSHRNGMAPGETVRLLEELIGPEGMRLYGEMNRKEEAQCLVVHVAGSLWSSEVPLTPAQADQLVGVFLATKTKPSPRSNVGVDWDAAVIRARNFLSAPQLAALEAERACDEQEGVVFRKKTTK